MSAIDVWDVNSFDLELSRVLDEKADLIRNYVTREKANFLAYDHGPRPEGMLRPNNPFAAEYIAFRDSLAVLMHLRTIRAWHYTRVTDDEIKALRQNGIHLSTPETLRQRLDALVTAGIISETLAGELIKHSPFQGEQGPLRTRRFWLTSHPRQISDSRVTRLLAFWGGEVASFWTDDERHLQPISQIGKPRVLEIAVPLRSTKQAFGAAQAVIAAYASVIGCVESAHGFDICVIEPLPASALINVCTEGDNVFVRIGDSYPANYIDADHGYWKKLTGEDD